MPLGYHPRLGEVLKCDFSGYIDPEMNKARYVVCVSPKHIQRVRICTIIPLSTTPPNPVENYHHKLVSALPQNQGTGIEVWAKCDMIMAASFTRLSPWWLDKTVARKRTYVPIVLSSQDIEAIQHCMLLSLGLEPSALTTVPP